MPFTVSHMAAVAPFAKRLCRARVLAAAAIGTMAPDFGLLWPVDAGLIRADTHGWGPLFTFALPAALLAWFLFEALIQPALLALLPTTWADALRAAGPPVELKSLRQWLLAILAILAGGVTHLAWDGFTHEDGLWVGIAPWLLHPAPLLFGRHFFWYQILQHVSTLVGLAILALYLAVWFLKTCLRWVPSGEPLLADDTRLLFGLAYVAVPGVLTAMMGYAYLAKREIWVFSVESMSYLAIIGMRWFALTLILVSALVRVRISRV